jgi:hypothetical protein
MSYYVVAGDTYNVMMKDGSRPTGPDDKSELGESENKPAPARDGTQFFVHPNATDAQIDAVVDAIVTAREQNIAAQNKK